VQCLIRMVAALERFISKSADRCKPLFQLLGRKRKFLWDDECSATFQRIKLYLSSAPCHSIPTPGEPIFLYLAVSDHAVSVVLIQEEEQEQKPIFFVSKVMNETEVLDLRECGLGVSPGSQKTPSLFPSKNGYGID
jgi:hypothetical protein